MSSKTYRVSEIFASIQGEGLYTGQPTIFIRLFGCNLECQYFGQYGTADVNDPTTWARPHIDIDLATIHDLSELPVFKVGCDSSYSWAARYKHLAKNLTAEEVVEKVILLAAEEYGLNLVETWRDNYNRSNSTQIQICFTGGEPLLQQKAIYDICSEFESLVYTIPRVTIETNATKQLNHIINLNGIVGDLHLSMSPKLFFTSGEKDAVKLDIIESYLKVADSAALKFVLNDDPRSWDELDSYLPALKKMIDKDVNCGIWIMPCGSTEEDLNSAYVEPIVRKALIRGLNVSMRVQAYCFGNRIGT